MKSIGRVVLERLEDVRRKAALLLGCNNNELSITRNTTEAMNAVAEGLHLKAGDRVLTTDQEHPGGLAGWRYLARHRGVIVDQVALPVPRADNNRIISRFAERMRPKTKVISISHVTYTTGFRLPVKALADLAHNHGALLIVDGAQAPGVLKVDVKSLDCDAYATSGHKWMLGPKGTGLLYIHERVADRIRPLMLQDGPGAYTASTGTRNLPAIIGLGAAIDLLDAIGAERIESRAMALRARLLEGLNSIGRIAIVSPTQHEQSSALATFTLPEAVDHRRFARTLSDRHRITTRLVTTPTVKGIRISTHLYNNEQDIDQLLEAVKALI